MYTTHTTERAAETSRRTLERAWRRFQGGDERDRWNFSVLHDPDDLLIDQPALDRDAARNAVQRIFVRDRPDGAPEVLYRCFPADIELDGAAAAVVHVERVAGANTAQLANRPGSTGGVTLRQWGNVGYVIDPHASTSASRHPYIGDLLVDVIAPPRPPSPDYTQVLHRRDEAAAELLPGSDTWELPATRVLDWLEQRSLIRRVCPGVS